MPKLTLNRVFALSLVGLLGALALLFWLVFEGLQNALLTSAQQACDRDSEVIGQDVTDYLGQAPAAAQNFEDLLQIGLTRTSDTTSLSEGLLTVLLANENISEATFTSAKITGSSANGAPVLDPASVGQVSLFRADNGQDYVHRVTWYQGGHYLSTHSHITPDGKEADVEPPAQVPDPSAHATFATPILPDYYGKLLWTDLEWFAIDLAKPETDRRVEVSVQETIENPPGRFAGVLRIGLFKNAIDRAIENPPAVDTSTHTIFLCDSDGRLIALSGTNHYMVSGDDLRLNPAGSPPRVLAALARPALRTVTDDNSPVSDDFVTSGTDYLCNFRMLPQTQQWIVGMAVPRRTYLEALWETRRWVIWGSLFLAVAIALFGIVVLHGVSAAHSIIVREAARINDFVLEPANHSSRLQDINRVLASLERVKTAMRSMGKYVPLDLVRRFYHRGEEPHLGGEATELTVLFSDIKGFTEFAEGVDPDVVAERLGEYLKVMVAVIQREKGTIDKFIGDSVMAFWNAPESVPGHSAFACRAALGCIEALAGLYASPAWTGTPGFETRFGLHDCVASVGHFGSPERFNYTAIGDGINFASRIESLNKYYGTSIIVSATVRVAAGPGFLFRRLDRVAVKGKTQCMDIYELVAGPDLPSNHAFAVYEQALAAWFEGDFARALALAETQPGDPPSVYLAARCRMFIETPPVDWQGVYVFESK
ncbi:MAG: adenylate/guanylate cyclase domain-containing protein [Chthoniobacteraceae bacterium]|jgi:adenylate cyclase